MARYVTQEIEYMVNGEKRFGWHVYDRLAGRTADRTQPSEIKRNIARKTNELNTRWREQQKK